MAIKGPLTFLGDFNKLQQQPLKFQFWPYRQITHHRTYSLRPKKPGFLPNLWVTTKYFCKNPVSDPPCDILITCHHPNSTSWQNYPMKLSALFSDYNSG